MIEVISVHDEKAHIAFSRFTMRRNNIMFAIFAAAFALFGIAFLFLDEITVSVLCFSVAGVMLIVPLALYLLIPKLVARGFKKKRLMQSKATNYFSFDDNFIYSKTVGADGTEGTSTVRGTALIRAAETAEYFYLYSAKNIGFVLPKKDFVSGAPEELRAILQSWLPGKKYKRYGKK